MRCVCVCVSACMYWVCVGGGRGCSEGEVLCYKLHFIECGSWEVILIGPCLKCLFSFFVHPHFFG